ncbi:MAG: hypothetical protein SchgKO_13180 [Schleiferiaceae bacterium]
MGPEGHKDAILILVWLWLFEEIQSAQKNRQLHFWWILPALRLTTYTDVSLESISSSLLSSH